MAGKAEIAILVKMRDEASRVMGGMAGNIERHAGTIRKAGMVMAGFGAALTVGLIAATKSALEQERGIIRLDVLLKKQGSSYEQVRVELERQIRATQLATGIGDELQREIIGKLIPVFGDYELAVKAMPLILDAMALSGMSAETVVRGLGRALSGQVNTAISVGLTFEKTMGVLERFAFVEKEISGLAAAMKDPFEAAAGAVGDLGQAIAKPLIEPLTTALGWIEKTTLAMSEMDPVLARVVAIALTGAAAFATFGGAFLLLLPTIAKSLTILKSMAAVMAVLRALTGPMGIAIALASIGAGAAVLAAVTTFVHGGVVPGPIGQPQLAVVHGGEKYLGAGGQFPGGAQTVNVTIQGGPLIMTDDRSMMRLASVISDAQRRRSRGTVGVNP